MSTKISWTDETWNIVTGCSPVSPGCRNCYAARMVATRLKHHPHYEGLAYIGIASGKPRWRGEIRLNHDLLERPLHWKKPRMIFTCSMGDLFHEDVPGNFIDRVFNVMAENPRHIYQILTKRPERMADFVDVWLFRGQYPKRLKMPSNVWLGVSVENSDYLWRVEELSRIPAAVRFVSLEPMLEAIDLMIYLDGNLNEWADDCQPIHWVIVGAESGPDRRPFDPAWALDVYKQCQAAGVPFFGKQSSGLRPGVPLLLGGREVKEWP